MMRHTLITAGYLESNGGRENAKAIPIFVALLARNNQRVAGRAFRQTKVAQRM